MLSWSLKQCDGIWTTQQSLTLHQWTRQQSPTSVATQLLILLLATDVGDCCLVHWCRVRDCCVIQIPSSHCFSDHDSIIPTCSLFQCFVNQWASSLHAACFCPLFTSKQHIPTLLSFFKSFCPCMYRYIGSKVELLHCMYLGATYS